VAAVVVVVAPGLVAVDQETLQDQTVRVAVSQLAKTVALILMMVVAEELVVADFVVVMAGIGAASNSAILTLLAPLAAMDPVQDGTPVTPMGQPLVAPTTYTMLATV
jgi:hypothetical protein